MKRVFPAHAYGEAPREKCYWSSTIDTPDYPAVQGEFRADVAVIGAGFTGLNAALHLSEAGEDVIVLEAQTPGWGASGRNGGFCCLGGAKASDSMMRRAYGEAARLEFRLGEYEAVKYAQALIAERGIDCGTHSEGETVHAHTEDAIRNLHDIAESVERDLGVSSTFIPKDKLAENGMNGPFHAALTTPIGYALNPLKYTLGLAAEVAKAGGRISSHSPVLHIDQNDGFTLKTPSATVRAKRLVVATNAYSSDDLPKWMAGRYLPTQTNVIVTRPLSDNEIGAQGWSTHQMSYDDRFFLHYFRLMPNKRMLFGMRGGLFSSTAADARMNRKIRKDFETMFPHWAHVETPYNWHGLVALSSDLTPYTGPIPEMPGAWTSLCYHGNGVAMGSYAGALIADQMLGRSGARLHPKIMQKPHGKIPLGRFRRATFWPVYAFAWLRGE
ncbi:NAD(P)/FAD-dependent oxidoreductase [Roseovarius sp. 2305UL8-3]|uniref:NAD(P)/FAD-dependent oxidoreductase n=1 Tax=Roseovarius conchicola TaxID=3121636 RepID=UPI0035299245